jgi:putative acetyltransferase
MIRPLEKTDAAAFQKLLLQPEIRRWQSLYQPTLPQVQEVLETPSGDIAHRLGFFEEGALQGVVELQAYSGLRIRHTASIQVMANSPELEKNLLQEAVRLSDRWLNLTRLEVAVDPEQTGLQQSLKDCGFMLEVTREKARWREGAFRDRQLWGRLRPGWTPEPPGEGPFWPEKDKPVEISFKRTSPEDAQLVAAQIREEEVAWGLLQVPSLSGDRMRQRMSINPADNVVFGVFVGEELIGTCGVHRHSWPENHVAGLGMSLSYAWQGRKLGSKLIEQLLKAGFYELGFKRLELEVYPDNSRAVRLYEKHGFKIEGTRRLATFRAGGFADVFVMGSFKKDA